MFSLISRSKTYHITAQKDDIPQGFIRNLKLKNITINGQKRF